MPPDTTEGPAAGDCAPSSALFVMLGIHVAHCLTDHATLTVTDYVHHALSCCPHRAISQMII